MTYLKELVHGTQNVETEPGSNAGHGQVMAKRKRVPIRRAGIAGVTAETGKKFREVVELMGKAHRAEQALRLAEADLERMLGRRYCEDKPWTDLTPLTVGERARLPDGLTEKEYQREVERYRLFETLLDVAGMSLGEYRRMVLHQKPDETGRV
jgi:hypothetical protein